MGHENYWNRRTNRRRALLGAGTAGLGVAALGLVGCGDDDDGGSAEPTKPLEEKQEEVKSFLWDRKDTTAQAVKGSIYQTYTTADATNLDPLASPSFTANAWGSWYYPRLMTYKPGYRVAANGEYEGYLAERFEQPDSTTVTFKLRQNAVWDERAPTNKRPIDAEDVVFSWKKFAEKGQSRKDLVKLPDNPTGPVESVSAPDKNTVVFKLAFPYAPFISAMAYSRYLQIMPRESEGGYDPRNETRSGGPWILSNYQRSVTFEIRKNPNFWDKDRVLLDGFDIPIIPEYAAQLAQFRAKKLWTFGGLRQEDVIATKKDLPDLQVDSNAQGRTCWLTYFGLQAGSPFLDPRVRQAASMLLDRDAWIDTFYNVEEFKKEGYPIEPRWHSHISAGWEGFWLDPRGAAMGENAKHFKQNVAEAKKLLDAAGVKTPIETDIAWISSGQYGVTFPKNAEVIKGMLEESGLFKLKQVNPDYQTDYLPKYYFAKGDFKGIAVGASTQFPEVDQFLFAYYHSKGSRQKVAFQGSNADATSDRLIEQQRQELDAKKRAELIKEWQRHVAGTMPMIPYPGQANTFSLFWPWVGNYGVFRAWDTESGRDRTETSIWFDKSKYTG